MNAATNNTAVRPPVVTVMGHIDHGKSTLLDYIRKTKVTETEAGGITQHISAYEVDHTTSSGETRRITFLDTPGHEAFQHLRSRGSSAADLAILVVAADDGVKPQTLEALKAIEEAGIPFLVAITKIDKANADIERTKNSLLEHGVYLEGLGGSVSFQPISSKSGEGVPELLDLLLLAADLEELTGEPDEPARGIVIESHCDPRRGISATLIIKNGSLKQGEYVVAGQACAPLRIIEDFQGKTIKEATFSSPVMVVGFSDNPTVGCEFVTLANKKAALEYMRDHENETNQCSTVQIDEEDPRFFLPVVLKSDVEGSIDAIKHELKKLEDERTVIQVIHEGVGAVAEGDIKHASGNKNAIIVGFNVGVDAAAKEVAERLGVEIATFSIIYDLADWLPNAIAARRPKVKAEKVLGEATILKTFSFTKKVQTIGCRVTKGELKSGDRVVLRHGDEELGRGTIQGMKLAKSDTSKVNEGNDCGVQVQADLEKEPVYNDTLAAFVVTEE